jgi:putative membrane protein
MESAVVRTDRKLPPPPDLGVIRTALAADRTLMAWIRTALSMISFGFTIYKFMHALSPKESEGPRRLGILLAAMGTTSLAAGLVHYSKLVRSLQGQRPTFAFYLGCAVIGLGLLVLGGILLRVGPLT